VTATSGFQNFKLWLVHLAGLPKDALHIYVGLAVFLGAAALSRRPLGHWLPLGAVLLAALTGEAWDLTDDLRYATRLFWGASWHDVWNTLFWPLVLFLLARRTRLLRAGRT
jgi:hypothetical protein